MFKKKKLFLISKTGFFVSLISYLGFWLMDIAHPGFVARYFSVHVFLLLTILFGIWWSMYSEVSRQIHIIHYVLVVFFGIIAAVLTWGLTDNLGSHQILITLIAFLTPYLVVRSLHP